MGSGCLGFWHLGLIGEDLLAALLLAPFVGSFLTVLVVRLPKGHGFVLGRSRCGACKSSIAWYDLTPIVGWLVLRGRCRACGAVVGRLYPMTELAAVCVVLWAGAVVEGSVFWASVGLGWTLLTIGTIDWREEVIPDVLSIPLVGAGFLFFAWFKSDTLMLHILGAVIGYAAFRTITFVYSAVRKREGLGQGDAKLLAAAGAWVSAIGLPSVVIWASFGAAAVLLGATARGKRLALDDRLPFGTFLCAGIWLVWLYGPIQLG